MTLFKTSVSRTGARKRNLRLPMIGIVVLLFVTGIAVTATAAPGPSSDVKTVAYGTPNPNPPTGPCATIPVPADAQTCQGLQNSYNKAKKACSKKSGAARKKCNKQVQTKRKKFKKYAKDHQYKP